ncbi:MAG: thioredoxin family protein [Chloroflexota bacterium]
MLERLVIVLVIVLVSLAAYTFFTRSQMWRISRRSASDDPVLKRLHPGLPAIIYFTTPGCIPCRTQQQPALAELLAASGDHFQIIQIDATQEPDNADGWGVLSAPTTFVIDARGKVQAVNHGVAHADKLRRQLGVG